MSYRRATIADLDRLVAIENECFDPGRYTRMSRRQFRTHLGSPNAVLIVVPDQAGIVQGYALGFRHAKRSTLRFYSLAVAPAAQRGDFGRILFRGIEEEAFKLGLGVQCEVRDDNLKLQKRYDDLGYRAYRSVAGYYPDGAGCIKYAKSRVEIASLFGG
jgi:ribosomal protein S18 acetylase RimI-like enzyme